MSNWQTFPLYKAAQIIKNGFQPSANDELPYIGLEHIEQQTLQLCGVGKGANVTSGKFQFQSGDILFGKLRPYFRKLYRPKFSGICSTDIWVVRAKPGFDQGFLFYFLANESFIDLCNQGSSGTRMPRADWNMLKDVEFHFPDLPIQRRIAEILSALDDKIALNRRMNQTLEQMAQTLFRQYFVDIDQDNLPEGWRWGKLREALELPYGKALKAGDRKGGEFPVVGSSGIVGYHNSFIAKEKGIMVGRKGNAGSVFWLDEKFYPIDTTYYVVDLLNVGDLYFHYFLLKSLPLGNMNSDSAVPGLNRNDAYNLDILLPDSVAIRDFNKLVEPLFDCKYKNDREINTLTKTRDTLLPKLMSGEIDVMNPQTDPLHEPVLS